MSKIKTWKNADGSMCSDARGQLQKIKAAKSDKIKNNAAELADALLDLVVVCSGSNVRDSSAFGYAVYTLGEAGIKVSMSGMVDRRAFKRTEV